MADIVPYVPVKPASIRQPIRASRRRSIACALIELRKCDVLLSHDARAVRLLDGKGRRKQPRAHFVPLVLAAAAALDAMHGGALGPYLFTATAGESGVTYSTLTPHFKAVVAAMQDAGELESAPFTLGDLRRTVETRLSAAGISKEHRSQLQNHGLGGVQDRHYDMHEYLEEKRAALETLHRIVTGHAANVTLIRKRKS